MQQKALDELIACKRDLQRTALKGNARWAEDHCVAFPIKFPERVELGPKHRMEVAISMLVHGLALYADTHAELNVGWELGEDCVLGEYWKDAARAVIGLLNGDVGRLDCGTLDGLIRRMAAASKVDPDLGE